MKKSFIIGLFLLGFSNAFGAVAVIHKVYVNRLEASAKIAPNHLVFEGDFFVAKFQGGNVCYLQILKIKNNYALLDLRICSMKNYIQIGQKLGDSGNRDSDIDFAPIIQESKITLSEKEDFWGGKIPDKEVFGFSLFLLYSFAENIEFTGTAPMANSDTKNYVQGTSSATGAAGIGFDYLYSKEMHFGWNFNGSLEFPRNFNYLKADTIGEDFSGSVPNSQLWLGSLALNLNFTLPKTYIPYAGINLSLPIVSGGDLKVSSQIGVQAGISKLFGKNLIIDVEYRWMNFRGGIQIPNEVVQFSSAQFYGFLFRVKYLFN